MEKRLIIDTDPGCDDAAALLMLLEAAASKRIEIEGILTVFGNGGLKRTTTNTGIIMDMFPSLSIPLYPVLLFNLLAHLLPVIFLPFLLLSLFPGMCGAVGS
jgi:Inosine-uridine preferring nucleoside hydrolase